MRAWSFVLLIGVFLSGVSLACGRGADFHCPSGARDAFESLAWSAEAEVSVSRERNLDQDSEPECLLLATRPGLEDLLLLDSGPLGWRLVQTMALHRPRRPLPPYDPSHGYSGLSSGIPNPDVLGADLQPIRGLESEAVQAIATQTGPEGVHIFVSYAGESLDGSPRLELAAFTNLRPSFLGPWPGERLYYNGLEFGVCATGRSCFRLVELNRDQGSPMPPGGPLLPPTGPGFSELHFRFQNEGDSPDSLVMPWILLKTDGARVRGRISSGFAIGPGQSFEFVLREPPGGALLLVRLEGAGADFPPVVSVSGTRTIDSAPFYAFAYYGEP